MKQTETKLSEILDFNICKKLIERAKTDGTNYAILCPHYSINIASKYDDNDELQWDLDDLSEFIGHYVEVSDYDDLIVNLTESED